MATNCFICGTELKFTTKAIGGIGKTSDGEELCRIDFLETNESLEKKNTVGKHTATEIKQIIRGQVVPTSSDSAKAFVAEISGSAPVHSGEYLSGFPASTFPCMATFTTFTNTEALCFKVTKTNAVIEVGRLLLSSIKDLSIEDASTIEKRITATRLLTTGIFAFALKKKEKHELHYLTVKFADGKFDSDLVFQFEGKTSQSSANTLRTAFAAHANKI